jgi:hypothetical protein
MGKGAGELGNRLERAIKAGEEGGRAKNPQGFYPTGWAVFRDDRQASSRGARLCAPK